MFSSNQSEGTVVRKKCSYLNYYFSYDVCACFRLSECLSVCLSAKKNLIGTDQARKFGEQTSRILEFKAEGLDF